MRRQLGALMAEYFGLEAAAHDRNFSGPIAPSMAGLDADVRA
jgi:hypothetical protein